MKNLFLITCFTISTTTLSVLFSSCSSEDEKPKKNEEKIKVEFETAQLLITEQVTERIELIFSNDTEPTDAFIITVTNGSAATSDYQLSEGITNNEFVLTASEPYFDLTAVFDALPESEETITLEITTLADGFEIGDNSILTVSIKNNNIGNNLVGEYLFNGDAIDSSPNMSNDGTVFGVSLTTDRAGTANNAYSFDGVNDYITIQDNDATDFSLEDFSISVWVDAASIQTDLTTTNNFIIRKRNGSESFPFGIAILNQTHPTNPNEFYSEVYDGCENGAAAYSGVITNVFKHYVLVKSGNKLIQYLNGVKISEVTTGLACATENEAPIMIGANNNLTRFFKGKIDDLRFYNAAIPQSLVTELYEE